MPAARPARTSPFFQPFSALAEPWQVQLLNRFLLITLALTTFLLLRDLASGMNPAFAGGGVLVAITGMLVVHQHKSLGIWVAAGLFFTSVLLFGLVGVDAHSSCMPIYCMLMLPGTMATMLEGPAFGGAVAGLMAAFSLGLAWAYPPSGRLDAYRLTNELTMLVFGYLVATAIDRTFRRMNAALQARTASLQAVTEAGHAMADALFADLRPLLQELWASLADPAADPAQGLRLVDALVGKLRVARSLFPAQGLDAADPGLHEADIRRSVARAFLVILICLQTLLMIRNQVWGGASSINYLALTCLPTLLWGLERKPRLFTPARVGGLVLLLEALTLTRGFLLWGGQADSPTLVLLPSLVLLASLLNGPWILALALAYSSALLLWAAQQGAPDPVQAHLLLNIGILQAVLSVIAFSVIRLRQSFLTQLRGQAQALHEALSLRRRLAGTLFHDVNNQLMALSSALELATLPGTDRTRALASAGQFCARIDGLVRVSKDFLLGDQRLDPPQLRPVPVPELFRDIESLFQGRLKAKAQTLIFMGDGHLKVLGLPEIVTESVLGNLVSNALKFSPPQSIIEVEAIRLGDEVALRVRDAGPGIPQALIDALSHDGPLPSSQGSAGETGQGYGLKLVREHLQRQGGRLDLSRPPQGGTEAIAWLKSA